MIKKKKKQRGYNLNKVDKWKLVEYENLRCKVSYTDKKKRRQKTAKSLKHWIATGQAGGPKRKDRMQQSFHFVRKGKFNVLYNKC